MFDLFFIVCSEAVHSRSKYWKRDSSSPKEYAKSLEANRLKLRDIIGVEGERLRVDMSHFSAVGDPPLVAETDRYRVLSVRWPVLEGIEGDGLLLTPNGEIKGCVIAIQDADQTPEELIGLAKGIEPVSQFARRLAENGFQVVVPVLVSRASDFSCSPKVGKTDQTHREWIYRQAFEVGRHIIGFEVQKVLAVVDWFERQKCGPGKIGVAGYGEGGLLAFYAAALDQRIDAALISGYFGPREQLWEEPIYRNVWGLLRHFGDSEIATLIAPRGLLVEYAQGPDVNHPVPDQVDPSGSTAAPGKLVTPSFKEVHSEFQRIATLVEDGFQSRYLMHGPGGTTTGFGSQEAVVSFAQLLSVRSDMELSDQIPVDLRSSTNTNSRQERQMRQIEAHVQGLVRDSDEKRLDFFLREVDWKSIDGFVRDAGRYRRLMWDELIGRLDDPQIEMSPRSRKVYDRDKWVGYEVVLDVWPEVITWGILCVPKDIAPSEKRPVVVCQHGLEGEPKDTIEDTEDGLQYYGRLTARLADLGFVTFAPHNPYRGAYRYMQLQRKANPLKASLGSVILAQHTQILNWLETLPFVDQDRIGFYGLSYGGWTAVRIPPLLQRYNLSICSAAFNDWARKVASIYHECSYLGYAQFEMVEWNAAHTFSNAEMVYLMIPRPFMVERGMHDGVAPDSWVASEYAKVRWLYAQLDIRSHTEIEYFDGEHFASGQGTFDFLHRHLQWPKPCPGHDKITR